MQVQLLVWIFVMRVMMLFSSALAYFLNGVIAKARYDGKDEMNYESPLTSLVWITSLVSIALTYLISYLMIPQIGDDSTQWWKLATIISCGTLAGAARKDADRIGSREKRGLQDLALQQRCADVEGGEGAVAVQREPGVAAAVEDEIIGIYTDLRGNENSVAGEVDEGDQAWGGSGSGAGR